MTSAKSKPFLSTRSKEGRELIKAAEDEARRAAEAEFPLPVPGASVEAWRDLVNRLSGAALELSLSIDRQEDESDFAKEVEIRKKRVRLKVINARLRAVKRYIATGSLR